jgi:hypothetical protein
MAAALGHLPQSRPHEGHMTGHGRAGVSLLFMSDALRQQLATASYAIQAQVGGGRHRSTAESLLFAASLGSLPGLNAAHRYRLGCSQGGDTRQPTHSSPLLCSLLHHLQWQPTGADDGTGALPERIGIYHSLYPLEEIEGITGRATQVGPKGSQGQVEGFWAGRQGCQWHCLPKTAFILDGSQVFCG